MPMFMKYARFQNTLEALRECYDDLREMEDFEEELSHEEAMACYRLIVLCNMIAEYHRK